MLYENFKIKQKEGIYQGGNSSRNNRNRHGIPNKHKTTGIDTQNTTHKKLRIKQHEPENTRGEFS